MLREGECGVYPGVCVSQAPKRGRYAQQEEFSRIFHGKISPAVSGFERQRDRERGVIMFGIIRGMRVFVTGVPCVCVIHIIVCMCVWCRVSLAIFACYPQHEAVIPQDLAYTHCGEGGGMVAYYWRIGVNHSASSGLIILSLSLQLIQHTRQDTARPISRYRGHFAGAIIADIGVRACNLEIYMAHKLLQEQNYWWRSIKIITSWILD